MENDSSSMRLTRVTPRRGRALLANKYELRDLVAVGTLTELAVAHQPLIDRRVALDLATGSGRRAPSRSGVRSYFPLEVAKLEHPALAKVYELCCDGDAGAFVVLEHLDGPTLQEQVIEDGPLRPADAIALGRALLEVVAVFHEAGLAHADLTPSHVVAGRRGTRLRHHPLRELMASGEGPRSSSYNAPEQILREPAKATTDLFRIASVLFFAMTGAPPFAGDDLDVAVLRGRRPAASELRPGLSRDVDDFFERALARDPIDRFGTAAEMREALRLLALFSGYARHA